MSTYAQTVPVNPAAGTFRILPEHWATSYRDKPLATVVVGYRLPSDVDLQWAIDKTKEWGSDKASEDEQKRLRINALVAACVCDVADAAKAHEAFPCPEDGLRDQLRPETIQAIFDEIDRAMIASSPTRPEIEDGEVIELVDLLLGDGLEALANADLGKSAQVRRMLRFCLDEIATVEPETGSESEVTE